MGQALADWGQGLVGYMGNGIARHELKIKVHKIWDGYCIFGCGIDPLLQVSGRFLLLGWRIR